MKRSVVFLLLGFACASLCAAGTVYGVKAEENASVTPETAGLEMTAGASVRMAESKETHRNPVGSHHAGGYL